MKKKDKEIFFSQYRTYSNQVRFWFVGYGAGLALVLSTNTSFKNALAVVGATNYAFGAIAIAVLIQVVGAIGAKWAQWALYIEASNYNEWVDAYKRHEHYQGTAEEEAKLLARNVACADTHKDFCKSKLFRFGSWYSRSRKVDLTGDLLTLTFLIIGTMLTFRAIHLQTVMFDVMQAIEQYRK